MRRKVIQLGLAVVILTIKSAAQTTNVTDANNGVSNTVPVFTGNATLGNSNISYGTSNGNGFVGINNGNPNYNVNIPQQSWGLYVVSRSKRLERGR